MTSARGIAFDYRPSVALTRIAACIVCLAALAVFATGFPVLIRLALSAATALTGWFHLRMFLRPVIRGVAWASDDVWIVALAGGEEREAVLRHSRVFGRAVFLELRWDGGGGQVALLPDNAPEDDLRLLRARLMSGVG